MIVRWITKAGQLSFYPGKIAALAKFSLMFALDYKTFVFVCNILSFDAHEFKDV